MAPESSGQWIGWPPVLKVAMAPHSGEFVVLWGTSANTSSGNHLSTTFTTFAQVFDPASTDPTAGATGQIVVGGGGKASNLAVSVAMNDSGFDVLYNAGTAGSLGISATVQQYNAAGQAQGSPVTITPNNAGYQTTTTGSISMDSAGDFAVVWDAVTGALANPGNYYYIDAQRYDSATQSLGSVVQASPNSTQYPIRQSGSTVSMDPVTGDFVVAWAETVPTALSGGGIANADMDLLARQFFANGTAESAFAIPVATATTNTGTWINSPFTSFIYPSGGLAGGIGLSALPGGAGAFDVTWNNGYDTLTATGSTTGSGWKIVGHSDVYAKSYDSSGAQTQWLAVTSDGTSSAPSAAADGNGDLLVLWNDTNQANVQVDAQLYKQVSQPAQSGFSISTTSSSPIAGQSFDAIVTAPAGYTGTIYLASSAASVPYGNSTEQGLPSLPASVTFTNGSVTSWSGNLTSASGGSATFSVALETAGQQTLTATSADGAITASATIDVSTTAAASFAVSTPLSDEAGTPMTFTVTALDVYGNVVTGYNGPIQLSTTDSAATGLPGGYVTLVDGVGTFTVTFNTTGNQTITASATITNPDGSTATISGTSRAIYVYPAPTTTKKH